MKNRLGIFVYYDAQGVVDKYVKYLLEDLKPDLTDLFIVVNGDIEPEGYEYFSRIAQKVIIRENRGLDGGAYADIVCNFLGQERLEQYDEIFFGNDTYYGPFIPWHQIFEKMENDSTDFWSISWVDNGLLSLMDAHAFVVKKRIIKSGDLFAFFQGILGKISNYNEACALWEIGIFYYLKKLGYNFSSYLPPRNVGMFYELLVDQKIDFKQNSNPILKRKCFLQDSLSDRQCQYILNCVKKHSSYDINFIVESVARIWGRKLDSGSEQGLTQVEMPEDPYISKCKISFHDIIYFLQENSEVYIYGTGLFGQILYLLIKDYFVHYNGFIVSDGRKKASECCGCPVVFFSEIQNSDAAILMSLSPKTAKELQPKMEGKKVLYIFE